MLILIVTIVVVFVLAQAADGPPDQKPVCCANDDGSCQDIGVPLDMDECGIFESWVHLSDDEFCRHMPECEFGCCKIKGKEQKLAKQKYQCVALCVDSGVCTCSGDSLDTCSPEGADGFEWQAGACSDPDYGYEYIQG